MKSERSPEDSLHDFLRYPPIEDHGVIGDRRTAALVAADGTIDWHCLHDYDGDPVFGCLLDAQRGGFWRFGPQHPMRGDQRYQDGTAVLTTRWEIPSGTLELDDAMLWPEDERKGNSGARCILRRLRCVAGRATVAFRLAPRLSFGGGPVITPEGENNISLSFGERNFSLWSSFSVDRHRDLVETTTELVEGEVLWALFGENLSCRHRDVAAIQALLAETIDYWRNWSNNLTLPETERGQIQRSVITVHLLTYAPAGSAVAAVSADLPERIGGDWNQDYRFSWVRDTSLSLALLSLAGKGDEVGKYLDWLCRRGSQGTAPLQVSYHVDGRELMKPREEWDLEGYRGSRPVRFGSSVNFEIEHGSVGYLADCTLIYLENGGSWKPEYWQLIRRVADYGTRIWNQPDNGVWEFPKPAHWVSSKVMVWVLLDRAIRIAEKVGFPEDADRWRPVREEIRREVLEKGWSRASRSFRQEYDSEEVDGALLLIPVMGFLQADDERVVATVRRIERELTVNGFVYRYRPEKTFGVGSDLPLGEFEGAFFITTFWLAITYAKMGDVGRAETILASCEALAGGTGLFAEGVDPASGSFRGNTPLLFSQVEYARAKMELYRARSSARGERRISA